MTVSAQLFQFIQVIFDTQASAKKQVLFRPLRPVADFRYPLSRASFGPAFSMTLPRTLRDLSYSKGLKPSMNSGDSGSV